VIILVRHGSAGDRDEWEGDDGLRPLDERGRRQADQLVDLLAGYELDRIFSSPAIRCVQTVEPLAEARGLGIEIRSELAEERQGADGPEFVRSLHGVNAALSCHGGLDSAISGESLKKGAALVLDGDRVVDRFRAKGKD
jgi:phosphohistidine phosphatase SixA